MGCGGWGGWRGLQIFKFIQDTRNAFPAANKNQLSVSRLAGKKTILADAWPTRVSANSLNGIVSARLRDRPEPAHGKKAVNSGIQSAIVSECDRFPSQSPQRPAASRFPTRVAPASLSTLPGGHGRSRVAAPSAKQRIV